MSLLDLRAESYIALGKLDLAFGDAAAMLKLANTEKKPAFKAQALNQKAMVQMRQGDLPIALKTSTQAVKQAQVAKDKAILRTSLLYLSEAQVRIGQIQVSMENAQKVIQLCQEMNDLSGEGRAWWVVGMVENKLGHAEATRRAAQTSLELCQQAGDQYGIGNALNVFTFTDMDIADRIKHLQQGSQAHELSGYVERQVMILANLSLAYFDLGLYPHARRIALSTADMNRKMGTKVGLAYALGNLCELEIRLGFFEAGRRYGEELVTLIPALGDQNMEISVPAGWGLLDLAEGNPRAAIRHFKESVNLAHQWKLPDECAFHTLLAWAYLVNGNASSALEATRRATAMHRHQGYAQPSSVSAQEIWWRHAQALLANKQYKAAREALERAYDFLLKVIANVRDEGLRRNLLNKVEPNRELLQYWVKDGKKRKLPMERLFAYLTIESSLREPFQRLADTGLRLNALHDLAGIQTFLVEEATELSGAERVLLILEKDGKRQVVESAFPYLLWNEFDRDAQKLLHSAEPYLKQARLTRTACLVLPKKTGLSRIIAPLIAQNQVTGFLYVDMDSLYGMFNETDRDMLGMLANQGAVALDNAQWTQGLEQKVAERTEALNARVNELAILNSVGDAMAKTLDVRTVSNIVGNKVAEIFHADNINIELWDKQTNLIHETYNYDIDQGGSIDPIAPFSLGIGMTSRVIQTHQSILIGTIEEMIRAGGYMPPEELERAGQDLSNFVQSEMVVPVIMGEQIIGAVIVGKKEKHAFDENDLRLLQTLSSNMAVAIENARLFEAEQQRVNELAILNSVGDAMAKTLDVRTVTKIVGDKVREIFHSEAVSIMLLDAQTSLIHTLYEYDAGEGGYVDYIEPFPLGKGLTSKVIQTREPLLLGTAEEQTAHGSYIPPELLEKGSGVISESLMMVPIVVGMQVLGVAGVYHYKQNAFSENDLRLLQTLSSNMGVAIQNARLFEAEQQRVNELAILNSVGDAMAKTLDVRTVSRIVGDKIADIFHADDVDIELLDTQTNIIHETYCFDLVLGGSVEPGAPFPLGVGMTSRVVQTRQSILAGTAEEQFRQGGYMPPADLEKFGQDPSTFAQSEMVVPVIMGEQVIGAVIVGKIEKNAFDENDLRLLQTLSSNMAVAIENARLFEAEQQRVAELQIINEHPAWASLQAGLPGHRRPGGRPLAGGISYRGHDDHLV